MLADQGHEVVDQAGGELVATPALQATGLSVSYGKVRALEEAELRVEEGEIVSLPGSNGAGKSTLLNALACVVPKQSGSVLQQHLRLAEDAWRSSYEVNVLAHVRAARLLIPEWIERGHGRFVVTASAAGLLTMLDAPAYSVTKHGTRCSPATGP